MDYRIVASAPRSTLDDGLLMMDMLREPARRSGFMLALYGSVTGSNQSGVDVDMFAVPWRHVSLEEAQNVVKSPDQFSWTNLRVSAPKGEAWDEAQKVAKQVAAGLRLKKLEDSLFYHAEYITSPS